MIATGGTASATSDSQAYTQSLLQLDAEVQERSQWRTLDPTRSRATLPSQLASRLLSSGDSPAVCVAFCEGLEQVVQAMFSAFPNNLFWDMDAMAATQLRYARAARCPHDTIARLWAEIAGLQLLFCERGSIRFRYVHDFTYGFDWARWVAKEPATRAGVGPFDPEFVQRMHRRGHELLATIAAGDDPKYPALTGSAVRNPFAFSREPQQEALLHRELARRGEVPVAGWLADAGGRWDRPFAELRVRLARELHTSS